MSKQIEQLSKDLAGGMSRRRAFWRFFGGIGGALLAGKAASARGDICVEFCHRQGVTGQEFGLCVAASAQCPPGWCAFVINGTRPYCVQVE